MFRVNVLDRNVTFLKIEQCLDFFKRFNPQKLATLHQDLVLLILLQFLLLQSTFHFDIYDMIYQSYIMFFCKRLLAVCAFKKIVYKDSSSSRCQITNFSCNFAHFFGKYCSVLFEIVLASRANGV